MRTSLLLVIDELAPFKTHAEKYGVVITYIVIIRWFVEYRVTIEFPDEAEYAFDMALRTFHS